MCTNIALSSVRQVGIFNGTIVEQIICYCIMLERERERENNADIHMIWFFDPSQPLD
jgi:hypothetical protein